ncbi:MAG: hypothetical protein JRI39_13975 [Deltaproteobacteria bacterium]|nr:hypothetical protein [Deltaproteobacteria bacterium]
MKGGCLTSIVFIVLGHLTELARAHRRPEVSLENAWRSREGHLAQARDMKGYVVDASRPLEEVMARLVDFVLKHRVERTRRRLGRWGFG